MSWADSGWVMRVGWLYINGISPGSWIWRIIRRKGKRWQRRGHQGFIYFLKKVKAENGIHHGIEID
jgi:hypothetical protein